MDGVRGTVVVEMVSDCESGGVGDGFVLGDFLRGGSSDLPEPHSNRISD